jgi:hypothetical protein
MSFILKSKGKVEKHKTVEFVLMDRLLEVGYYGKLEEVIQLQYNNE